MARSTLWSQLLIFFQSKRPSTQSAEGIQSHIVRNAEGMENLFVRKPKTMAYLCELKRRRSPKKSSFVRNAEGMQSPIVHNVEGILIYLKNIALSNKNDAGVAGV